MKSTSLLLLAFWSALPFLNAQDFSHQAAAATASPGLVKPGAAMLTSMEVLDNNRPISIGDTVSIRILNDRHEALQQRVAVTGEVQTPYIGLVQARGKTCRELAYAIKKELDKSFFRNAAVVIAIDQIHDTASIIEREVESYVMFGFVNRQGKYDLPANEDISISQAILRAGGFAQFANMKNVRVIRKTPQGNKTILVNVDAIMTQGQLEKDIFLRKDDVVIVKESKINI
jgi:polysaccharide export outer membrane protein